MVLFHPCLGFPLSLCPSAAGEATVDSAVGPAFSLHRRGAALVRHDLNRGRRRFVDMNH